MDKRKRELARAIKPYGYKIVGTTGTSHYLLRNRETGHELTASMSPRRMKYWLTKVVADIERYGS